jgi:hypothetical protein
MSNLSEIRYQQREVQNYLIKHNGRELYERVRTRQNLTKRARVILSEVLEQLFREAPVRTGYGKRFGIRLKRVSVSATSRRRSQSVYDIIIGSEFDASNHQLRDAPYMAWHNRPHYFDKNTGNTYSGGTWEGWVDLAIYNIKQKFKENGILVLINKSVISNYPAGGVSGYRIRINMGWA